MLFDYTYKEITSNRTSIYKEKGSKFFAYAYPVKTEEEIKHPTRFPVAHFGKQAPRRFVSKNVFGRTGIFGT